MFRRICLGVGGCLALLLAVYWIYGVVAVLDPDFNPRGGAEPDVVVGQAVVGAFGVPAALLAGGSALAYVKTGSGRWLHRVVVGTVCAVPLFCLWYYLLLGASQG